MLDKNVNNENFVKLAFIIFGEMIVKRHAKGGKNNKSSKHYFFSWHEFYVWNMKLFLDVVFDVPGCV